MLSFNELRWIRHISYKIFFYRIHKRRVTSELAALIDSLSYLMKLISRIIDSPVLFQRNYLYVIKVLPSSAFPFNRKEQVTLARIRIRCAKLTRSHLTAKNQSNKCNNFNCILFGNYSFNRSNVSQYGITFGFPNETQTCLRCKQHRENLLYSLKRINSYHYLWYCKLITKFRHILHILLYYTIIVLYMIYVQTVLDSITIKLLDTITRVSHLPYFTIRCKVHLHCDFFFMLYFCHVFR